MFLENDTGQCGANYTWQHPQVSDNCGAAIMTVAFESDDNIALPPSGDVDPGTHDSYFFSVGLTRVIYTMTDEAGNKSICGFDILVEDTELPLLNSALCVDQTIQLAANQCFVPVSALSLPPVTENCGANNLILSGFTDGLSSGQHNMILGFTDGVGNSSSCSFMVTVLPFVPSTDPVSYTHLTLPTICSV